ncbi:MAG: LexA family protein [Pyrinomonadaceae bacterium]
MLLPSTKKQRDVLEYIRRFMLEQKYCPSYQQIARELGLRSKGAIAKHIEALEKQGFLKRIREGGSFRISLRQTTHAESFAQTIDFFDDLAEDSQPEKFSFSHDELGVESSREIKAYQVPDDSMLEFHICEGDIALFETRAFARDRDLVLVSVENNRLLFRKYFRRGARTELRPANENFETEFFASDKVCILGVFKVLIRPSN